MKFIRAFKFRISQQFNKMWKLILTALFLGCSANTHTSVKPVTVRALLNPSNSSIICDDPPPTIEPEKCCDLPNFFNES